MTSGTDHGGAGFLLDGPPDAPVTLLLAHGAGAPMDTPWMNAVTAALCGHGLAVARFEFAYMADRRDGGKRKPPPRTPVLEQEFSEAIERLDAPGRLVIGGKSMGGRIASMIADDLYDEGRIAGLVCLGYPFHPPGRPATLRTAHLAALVTPALICQGTRDPFGTREEVGTYDLSPAIGLHWVEDGDHDLKPRKASGLTLEASMAGAADAISRFVTGLN